jgi:hypothetical protein
MLQEVGADDSLRCVPGNSPEGDRITGRLLHGGGHWSPAVTVQAVTARCMGRNSPN